MYVYIHLCIEEMQNVKIHTDQVQEQMANEKNLISKHRSWHEKRTFLTQKVGITSTTHP
jgi:hypothetical protein